MMIEFLLIYAIYIFLTSLATFIFWGGFTYFNPKNIYKKTKLNWFGTALVTLLLYIALPHIWIIYIIIKLCTMGRKDA